MHTNRQSESGDNKQYVWIQYSSFSDKDFRIRFEFVEFADSKIS